ncbi:MAG: hypothetical protein N4A36_04300 [Candidatus Gracilibacteria bacterium]|jgi:uncharacterized membrane protein|nr:hypothetical protein [Candidatus Gracilibacteria bacterium]
MTYPQETLDQFQKENGMSLEEAWEYVKRWNFEGKKDQAIQGCKEIVKFFPDHEAKDLLEKMSPEQAIGLQAENKVEDVAHKLVDGFNNTIGSMTAPEKAEEKKAKEQEAAIKLEAAKQKATTNDERMYAAMSYLWVLVFIPLLLKKESEFAKFHAKQGVILFAILYFFDATIVGLLSLILGSAVVGFAFGFVLMFVRVFFAFQAWNGKWIEFPLLYGLSKKISL